MLSFPHAVTVRGSVVVNLGIRNTFVVEQHQRDPLPARRHHRPQARTVVIKSGLHDVAGDMDIPVHAVINTVAG